MSAVIGVAPKAARARCVLRVAAITLATVAAAAFEGHAAGAVFPHAAPPPLPLAPITSPHHGSPDAIAFGAQGELRFGHDRIVGIADQAWLSVVRASSFVIARPHPRLAIEAEASYDHGTDDYTVERARLSFQARPSLQIHAGILPLPLGRENRLRDMPSADFTDRSLVATDLIGVPSAQIGIGARGRLSGPWSYEADLVAGYDEGIVLEGPGGTSLPSGRNNFGDPNGIPALVARVSLRPAPGAEFGFAAQSGPYNRTSLDGITIDRSRFAHLAVVDATAPWAGLRISGEAAAALVDVPPGLEGLYAERQIGATVEASRPLRAPLVRAWRESALSASVRAEAVDLDLGIRGDSRMRIAWSLNLRHASRAVLRAGGYHEVRRDRFDNPLPAGGLTLSLASFF